MTEFWKNPMAKYPPGLRELAEREKLSKANVKTIFESYRTIRGQKPNTLDEWYEFYWVIKRFLEEDENE